MDRVEYSPKKEIEDKSLIPTALNSYAATLGNYHLPMIEAEKNRIMEEWALVYSEPSKWKFLTEQFGNDKNTITESYGKVLSDDFVTNNQHKIKGWLNNQVNQTFDFSSEELQKIAANTYGSDNMYLNIKSNIPKEEMLAMVKASHLTRMKQTNKEDPLRGKTLNGAALRIHLDLEYHKVGKISYDFPVSLSEADMRLAKDFLRGPINKRLQRDEPYAYLSEMIVSKNKTIGDYSGKFEGAISINKRDIYILNHFLMK